ncbi:MAG TPA: TIGR03118 family protein [Candidatus Didemnitutus sp.]|nr:TIGR03118 family protein [Candidatus Didemnitutus sp.]
MKSSALLRERPALCLISGIRSHSKLSLLLLAGAVGGLASPAFGQSRYLETNLVSDVPGLAAATDPHLVNPWGLSVSPTSPWWVSDNGTGLSTLYNGAGAIQSLVVTIPTSAGATPPATPTGTVFNGTADFEVGTGQPAKFLFANEDGAISGWNPAANATNAIVKVDNGGKAVYKGLALAQIDGANYLYAANFFSGAIDVFDRTFAPVNLGAGAFRDPWIPKGYAPFNVQLIGTQLYVTYAKQDSEKMDEVDGAGRGFVSVFTTKGQLVHRLLWGPWMNAPWGVALAPANFGRFSGKLLVGQFGSGEIAVFDPSHGFFLGRFRVADGHLLKIDGLWALAFGNGAGAGPVNTLYFTAGLDGEAHGLFGTLTPTAATNKGGDKNDGDDDDDDGD